jgi:hypothetical protein|tara:strand:- start:914 stop:1168 length:255 start_codon:yes stop_codon:yes gene_type:complete
MFYDAVVMADLQEQLAEIHEEVVSQVLEDLRNGDRKARAEAMQLLKQNNVTAVAQEGSTLRKLAGKLDFSQMEDKVVSIKREAG